MGVNQESISKFLIIFLFDVSYMTKPLVNSRMGPW